MERSARVYRPVGRETCSFFSCAETNVRRHRSHGRVYFFFSFLLPPRPTVFRFVHRSIDRSIDPRREIVCRIETAALCRFLCAVYLRVKRKAPNTGQQQPETGSTSVGGCAYGYVYAWGWVAVRAGNVTSRRRIVHDQVVRVTFFSGYERCCFRWDEPVCEFGEEEGWLSAMTFGDFDEFRLGNRWGMKRSFRRALEFWMNFLDLDFFFFLWKRMMY